MNFSDKLHDYRNVGFKQIQGWCYETLFETLQLLDGIPINKKGGCLEIGVHHGKLYILMNHFIASTEQSYVVDVFDLQHLNIDSSGRGSLEIFKENLLKFDLHEGNNTAILVGDSTDPSLDLEGQIGKGSMRFISIDGGHTVEHTISDLRLANQLISNEGVVILDDILNYHWLGVIEGTSIFLSTRPTLVPFAIGHNKLYLCKLSFRDFYYSLFSGFRLKTKSVSFYGHKIVAL